MVRANENPPQGTENLPDSPPPGDGTTKGEPPPTTTVEPPPVDIRADIAEPDKKG